MEKQKKLISSFEHFDASILRIFLIIFLATLGLYALKAAIIQSNLLYIDLVMMLLVGVVYYINHRGKHHLSAILFSWVLLVLILVLYAARPEIVSPVLVWACTFPLIVVMTAGLFQGIFQTTVLMSAIVVLVLCKKYYGGAILPIEINDEVQRDFFVNFMAVPVYILMLSVAFAFYKKKAIQLLNKSFLEKKALLSVLYHDFANMIHIVDGQVKLMRRIEFQNSDSNKYLNKATNSLGMMKDLLHQIKELESFRDGKREFQFEVIEIRSLCEKIEEIFHEKLQSKNIRLDYEGVDSSKILTEPISLLNCVLLNIISNSIKFSFEGSTIVMESYEREGKLFLEIQDQGIGISHDKIKHLFSLTNRTTSEGTKGEKGSGYGLPIAKEILNFFDGDIAITSNREGNQKGTTVTLIFNLAE